MKPRFVMGEDFYVDPDGRYVFTAAYLRKRGYCCGNGCRHCPYGSPPDAKPSRVAPGEPS